ncbi:MAG TPA: cupin domain-containing protein [Burkholderiaceae bacterium]|nr:cupin domain-containing protein [Burkholderiaceae bacterium]
MAQSPVLQRLGSMPVARFMRDVWQRRPLLIRNAFPGFVPPVPRNALFELARRDDAESRLITRVGDRWSLKHGPLPKLPSTRRPRWTLLVQGVDLLHEDAHALLHRFRFVPDARLDDLMVSYASDGGGIGPHVDSYDVFLLQAWGRRRWRISRQRDLDLVSNAPLKLLADFRADEEWTLEAGDMLYLPPGVAHDGTALGECLTYSIGFRAPTYQELLEPWLADFADHAAVAGRYADRGLLPARRPAALPAGMVRRIHDSLHRNNPTRRDTQRFLLRYLTEPKAQIVFARPARPVPAPRFAQLAARRGIELARPTRMMYADGEIGINGEHARVPAGCGATLRALADRRVLPSPSVAQLPLSAQVLLHAWYAAGWLRLGGRELR